MSRTAHEIRIYELNKVKTLLINALAVAKREQNGQINGLMKAIQVTGERKKQVKEGNV